MSNLLKLIAVPGGARVAVLSPAAAAKADRVERGLQALRALGYDAQPGEHMLDRGPLYFAGEDEARLSDLHHAFADDEIRAIFATRGGYGSNYLLEALDLDLIAESAKPFVGYSDLTAVQLWLLDQVQLPVFYGPMLSADFSREDGVHTASLRAALTGQTYKVGAEEGLRTLRAGEARGRLYGGCLSIITALLGTPFEPQTEGKLLFLEDTNEKPYKVDRMLWQLRQAGKLEGVTGIVFGEMLECAAPNKPGWLEEAMLGVLEDFEGPIAIGLRSGHVSRQNVTLTLGVQAQLRAGDGAELELMEAAVEKRVGSEQWSERG